MARDLRLQVVLHALDRATGPLRTIDRQAQRAGLAMRDTQSRLQALNGTQRQVGEFRALRQGLDGTRMALASAAQRAEGLGRQLSATATPTRALRREFDQARRQLQLLEQQELNQSRQLQQVRQSLGATGIDTRRLATHERQLGSDVRQTTQRLEAQRAELQRVGRQQQSIARARSRMEATRSTAGSMAGHGAAATATGSGLLYAGARVIQPGLDFDASQSKVQALARLDKDSDEMTALRAQARHLGASTQFTATDASDAQGYLAMAGYTSKDIRNALPGVLSLAKAGDEGLAESADIASNILTGFNLNAAQTDKVGDILVGTFTRSNTNLRMLGETMKYVAPVASALGQDIETVSAMTGNLASASIQGSMAGTALRSILSRLAAPPKEAQKALARLSVSTKDANGNLRDMPGLLAQINRKTSGLGNTERTELFKAIAGEEAFGALEVLAQRAGSGELQAFIGQLRNAQGEATNASKVMADNLRGDLDALGSAWADFGIQLEEQEDGPLRSLTRTLTGLVSGMKAWAEEHPALTSHLVKAAAGIGVVMAGMGGLTLAMATLLGPFAMLRFGMMMLGVRSLGVATGLRALAGPVLTALATGLRVVGVALWGLAANPVTLAIGATVALLAGAAYLLYRNWNSVRGFFSGMWDYLSGAFSAGVATITNTFAAFSPLRWLERTFSSTLETLGTTLPGRFRELGGTLITGLVSGLRSALTEARNAVAGLGDSLISSFKEKLGIHSPSRVFSELGHFTMAGLRDGLSAASAQPLQAVTAIGERLARAGQVDLSARIHSTAPRVDSRGPLRAPPVSAAGAGGSVFNIVVHSAAGMDPHAIARAVAAELDRREHAQAVRRRSALFDQD